MTDEKKKLEKEEELWLIPQVCLSPFFFLFLLFYFFLFKPLQKKPKQINQIEFQNDLQIYK
jgi:preprotein translocase subunit YajC